MLEEFWNAATFIKVMLLLVTYPLWAPILKVMWQELQDALAPEGGVYGKRQKRDVANRPPGQDPWLNVPLASHRQRLGGSIPRPIAPPTSSGAGSPPSASSQRRPSDKAVGAGSRAGRKLSAGASRRSGF